MSDEPVAGRLAELTIALSLATDLGTGQPMEHGLRTCWLSLCASEALGLDAATRSTIYYVALLRFLGCTSDASDTAVMAGGDEVAFNQTMAPMLNAGTGESARHFMSHLASDQRPLRRAGRVARAMTDPKSAARSLSGHCEVAERLATRLALPEPVRHSLAHGYERWDGKGYPRGLAGDAVPLAIRVVTVARDVELWAREAGWSEANEVLTRRKGRAYDPAVVDVFADGGKAWLANSVEDLYAGVLDGEPGDAVMVEVDGLDDALLAIADFTDLKSPFFRGHSSGVAELAGAAAAAAGLPIADALALRRAALVHDVGRVGVSSGVWDQPGPLRADQWERVRLHPYFTERVLRRSALVAPFAGVASCHHERVDGSGYHRGSSGDQLAISSRLLAAADAFQAMTEPRPHRAALTPDEASAALRADADDGRFARSEVDAVLAAVGQPTAAVRVERPANLTEREVDVLRLIARGRSNKEAAADLGISRKTVGHHIEHIYAKAGVSTRAGATLFAMESGLLAR